MHPSGFYHFCHICTSMLVFYRLPHLQQLQKNKFENREFLKAEVAGSMGLSAVIARLLSHFY